MRCAVRLFFPLADAPDKLSKITLEAIQSIFQKKRESQFSFLIFELEALRKQVAFATFSLNSQNNLTATASF